MDDISRKIDTNRDISKSRNACPIQFAQFSLFLPLVLFSLSSGHEQQEQDQVNEDQRLQYYEYQQQQHQNFLQRYESPVSEEFDPRRFQSLERAKWYF